MVGLLVPGSLLTKTLTLWEQPTLAERTADNLARIRLAFRASAANVLRAHLGEHTGMIRFFVVATLLLAGSGRALADDTERQGNYWYLQTSVYTKHWTHDPDHNNHQNLIGVERIYTDGLLWGAATFRNSFYQRSYYGYIGMVWESDRYPVYIKLSAGLIEGYKGDYDDKIPLNHLGIAPVVIPSIGAHFGPVGAEIVILGTAAMMVNMGVRF